MDNAVYKNNVNNSPRNQDDAIREDEISLYNLLFPLIEQWKILIFTVIIGLLVGVLAWYLKGYEAELRAKTMSSLDFAEWRGLSSALPPLAETKRLQGSSQSGKEDYYEIFSRTEWWAKHVTPEYKYSKNDLKELGTIAKSEQEDGATRIERLEIRARAFGKEQASGLVVETEQFIREGGAFLSLKSLVNRFDLDTKRITTALQAKMSKDEVELDYLNKRAVYLEVLRNKYPGSAGASVQTILDPKDSSARYLPLSTQLVAVKTEINGLEESLSRSKDRLEEAGVLKVFVDKAIPLLETKKNGIVIGEELILVAREIKLNLDESNKNQVAAINKVADELDNIVTRFKIFFEPNNPIVVRRPSWKPLAVLGLLGGLLCGVALAFSVGPWRRAKQWRAERAAT